MRIKERERNLIVSNVFNEYETFIIHELTERQLYVFCFIPQI